MPGGKHIFYADLWGRRENKYKALSELDVKSTEWQELKPTAPNYFFVPKDFLLQDEYNHGFSLTECFPLHHNGIGTDRDELFYDFTADKLEARMKSLLDGEYDDAFRQYYHIWSSSSYDLEQRLKAVGFRKDNIRNCLYRPFDIRKLYYDAKLTSRPAFPVMRQLLEKNIAICTTRQIAGNEFRHVLVSNCLVDRDPLSLVTRERTFIFPLYLYPTADKVHVDENTGKQDGIQNVMAVQEKREPNLDPEFTKVFSEKLGLRYIEDGKGDLQQTFGPEDVLNYTYAVLYSPRYRSRYAEFLKIDFPRLPLTSDKALFKVLAEKGGVLVTLHLMESPLLNKRFTKYEVQGEHSVDNVSYDEKTESVSINKTQHFDAVPKEVWNFHIGGYQVCEKWLKDRKGRKLTIDDIDHYQKIVVALKETIRLMSEIDEVIAEQGGWPRAFE
jgi:Predicted helicase